MATASGSSGPTGVFRDACGPYDAHALVELAGRTVRVARLGALTEAGLLEDGRLPFSLRVLLENLLRHCGDGLVTEDDVVSLAEWPGGGRAGADGGRAADRTPRELAFMPSRVLLQDLTGVPCVVDLAAMRSAVARLGGDPTVINPVVPVDLVIDHSVHVDFAGTPDAYGRNVALEMRRNVERYELLRWAQGEFRGLRVVPPGSGIVHQVNLEYLASVVHIKYAAGLSAGRGGAAVGGTGAVCPPGRPWAFPDTVIGTDSHTTMINGLGVLGWGVGGIEAEAVMLGQPYIMPAPEVVGVRLSGSLPARVTATDLVLTLTQLLRGAGVVGAFVEYFGPGAAALSLPDRATVANMAPEYGATMGFFPVDGETLRYLALTGRPAEQVAVVEQYCRLQGLFRDPGAAPDPSYSRVLRLDLGEVEPSLAGPRRPQDRVRLGAVRAGFTEAMAALGAAAPALGGDPISGAVTLRHGAVVIASITSCTNTSNPAAMIGAGLLARNAVRRGLRVPPWVKTSLAPGSRVVPDYLAAAGVLEDLETLRFHVVGLGCATCIGNSGPLPEPISRAIKEGGLVTAAVLSGNRNFEARVHALVRANYLASPPLVVAYALAGTVDVDMEHDPLGHDLEGRPVYLHDVWPDPDELAAAVAQAVRPEMFRERYAHVFEGDEAWREMAVPLGDIYRWDPGSTYIQEPPFLEAFEPEPSTSLVGLRGARILALFGDSVTTDHISPAGSIAEDGPAGLYLQAQGVAPADFNTYGSRRGNHQVLMRGTFGNPRLRNLLVEREGGFTRHFPSGDVLTIFEASIRYRNEGVPLVVLAGKEYGSGSSRDWAAKGPALLGVRAVVAESFERIHRSNLVGMGILPLQFEPGSSAEALGLTGRETLDVQLPAGGAVPGSRALVRVRECAMQFHVDVRLDSAVDVENYSNGGILPRMLALMQAGAC